MKRGVWLFFLISFCCLPAGKLIAAATLTTLHIFHNTDGSAPMAGLVQATNGNFYGTTAFGGAYSNCIGGCGTVFEITPTGNFTLLHSFTNYDGSEPLGGLVQGGDGNLYGTTTAGGRFGPGGLGSVFRISPSGEFAMIHSFTTSDGFDPGAGLIIGPDGAFYGTTSAGGQNGVGTVYRITTNGDFSVLNGVDQPAAPILLASDGNFYGTEQFGGSSTNVPMVAARFTGLRQVGWSRDYIHSTGRMEKSRWPALSRRATETFTARPRPAEQRSQSSHQYQRSRAGDFHLSGDSGAWHRRDPCHVSQCYRQGHQCLDCAGQCG